MARKRLEVVFEFEEEEVGCLLVEATQRNLWEVGCNVDAALRCTIRSVVYEAIVKALPEDAYVDLVAAGVPAEGRIGRTHTRNSLWGCWAAGYLRVMHRWSNSKTAAETIHLGRLAQMVTSKLDSLPG